MRPVIWNVQSLLYNVIINGQLETLNSKFINNSYDLITDKILNELPHVAIKFITQLMNAILRLGHFLDQWKIAQIILIPKPGKPHRSKFITAN